MKIKLTATIEIDPKDWNAEYGTDEPAGDIRDAIKGMSHDALLSAFSHLPLTIDGSPTLRKEQDGAA